MNAIAASLEHNTPLSTCGVPAPRTNPAFNGTMTQRGVQMSKYPYQKMNASTLAHEEMQDVVRWAEDLLQAELPAAGWSKTAAAYAIEKKWGIPAQLVLDLTRESRRPKSIASHWKRMFSAARLSLLEAWAAALGEEIERQRQQEEGPDLDAIQRDLAAVCEALSASRLTQGD